MPEVDGAHLRTLSGTMVRSLEPVIDPEVVRAIGDAAEEFESAMHEAIVWKRDHMADDVLSALDRGRGGR